MLIKRGGKIPGWALSSQPRAALQSGRERKPGNAPDWCSAAGRRRWKSMGGKAQVQVWEDAKSDKAQIWPNGVSELGLSLCSLQ